MEVFRKIKRTALLAVACASFADHAEAQTIGAACSFAAGTSALIRSTSTAELLICDGTTWGLAEAMTTGGNVGIGTAAPATLLHVYGNVSGGTVEMRVQNANVINPQTSIALINNNASWTLVNEGNGSGQLGFYDVVNNNRRAMLSTAGALTVGGSVLAGGSAMSVKGGASIGSSYYTSAAPTDGMIIQGNVGIATTVPKSVLDVNGNITIGSYAGTTAAPSNSMIISGTVAIGTSTQTTGTALDLGTNANSVLLPVGTTGQRPTGVNGMLRYNSTVPQIEAYYSGGWNVLGGGAATTITLGTSASVTNPQRSGDATTGLFSPAVSTVALATAGTERVRIDSSGNIGIGTTSPATNLHVRGNIGGSAAVVARAENINSAGSAQLQAINDAGTGAGVAVGMPGVPLKVTTPA